MNHENDDAQLGGQREQQPQKRNRINPTGDSNANPVTSSQQFLPPDMPQHALRQFMHASSYIGRYLIGTLPAPVRESGGDRESAGGVRGKRRGPVTILDPSPRLAS